MTVESLITQHIDTWTSTVKTQSTSGRGSRKKLDLYGIKKLRELILELAVRGKLVPQDPNDEPTSELLQRNFDEQDRLIKSESLKTKANRNLSTDDEYLIVPISWERIRLGNLAKFIDYRGKTPKKIESGIRLITAKNVKFGHISLFPEEFISEDEYKTWMTRGFPRIGDILFTPEAPLGNVAQVNLYEKFALAQRAICFQFHIPQVSNFLKLFLMTPSFQSLLLEKATGTTAKGIKASVLKELLIYIPPLAEQHRIVAKVDELMALCDQLEQQTEASIKAHQLLVSTLLNTLTNSANADELMENWARISDHFDTLFITEESIDQLKQTILQLAVMGKLVPQDTNDEPASVLLERIAEEKAQLIKEKKIKKQKALPPIADDEKPFDLPNGWEWCRLSEVIDPERDISYGIIKLEAEPELGGVPTLRCSDVKPGYIDMSGVRNVVENIEEQYKRTRLQGGEVLLNIRGTLGGVALVPDSLNGYNIAREVAMLAVSNAISGEYLRDLILSPFFWLMIESNLKGIAYKGLNLNLLREFAIPLPPRRQQNSIVNVTSSMTSVCDQLKARLKESQTTQLRLTDAIVEQAV